MFQLSIRKHFQRKPVGGRGKGATETLGDRTEFCLRVALNIRALLMAEDFPGGTRTPVSKMGVNPREQPSNEEEGLLAAWE